jgi:hypothetical protein
VQPALPAKGLGDLGGGEVITQNSNNFQLILKGQCERDFSFLVLLSNNSSGPKDMPERFV